MVTRDLGLRNNVPCPGLHDGITINYACCRYNYVSKEYIDISTQYLECVGFASQMYVLGGAAQEIHNTHRLKTTIFITTLPYENNTNVIIDSYVDLAYNNSFLRPVIQHWLGV